MSRYNEPESLRKPKKINQIKNEVNNEITPKNNPQKYFYVALQIKRISIYLITCNLTLQ